jgi:hypothetical protein
MGSPGDGQLVWNAAVASALSSLMVMTGVLLLAAPIRYLFAKTQPSHEPGPSASDDAHEHADLQVAGTDHGSSATAAALRFRSGSAQMAEASAPVSSATFAQSQPHASAGFTCRCGCAACLQLLPGIPGAGGQHVSSCDCRTRLQPIPVASCAMGRFSPWDSADRGVRVRPRVRISESDSERVSGRRRQRMVTCTAASAPSARDLGLQCR